MNLKDASVIIRELRDKGYRITRLRHMLVELFCNSLTPLTVNDIGLHLLQIGNSVNKTTVYREINFLIKEGLLEQIDLSEGFKRYELKIEDNHHHAICMHCKRIECIKLPDNLIAAEKWLLDEINFTVSDKYNFYGMCGNCGEKI